MFYEGNELPAEGDAYKASAGEEMYVSERDLHTLFMNLYSTTEMYGIDISEKYRLQHAEERRLAAIRLGLLDDPYSLPAAAGIEDLIYIRDTLNEIDEFATDTESRSEYRKIAQEEFDDREDSRVVSVVLVGNGLRPAEPALAGLGEFSRLQILFVDNSQRSSGDIGRQVVVMYEFADPDVESSMMYKLCFTEDGCHEGCGPFQAIRDLSSRTDYDEAESMLRARSGAYIVRQSEHDQMWDVITNIHMGKAELLGDIDGSGPYSY